MTVWLLVLVVAVALNRKKKPRAMRMRIGAHDNPVVAGRAILRCGCALAPGEVQPCAAHAALAELQP